MIGLARFFTRSDRDAEVQEAVEKLHAAARQNSQIVSSAVNVSKRRSALMQHYAGAMEIMARGNDEDR